MQPLKVVFGKLGSITITVILRIGLLMANKQYYRSLLRRSESMLQVTEKMTRLSSDVKLKCPLNLLTC